MGSYKCPLCAAGGCLDMHLAFNKQDPVKCPISKHFIYFRLPAGMVPATIEDFYQNGDLRINMPFLIYDTRMLYHAFFIDEFILRRELVGFIEIGNIYILAEHKQLNN